MRRGAPDPNPPPLGLARQDCPEALRALYDAAGEEAVLALARAHGGGEITIPLTPRPDRRLAAVVGAVGLAALCDEAGGCTLYAPTLRGLTRRARNTRILADYLAGRSVRALAAEHRLSVRHIKAILNSPET